MKKSTHMKIVFWLKAVLFGAFAANIFRILWRTWKYGGSKSTHEVTFDGQHGPVDLMIGKNSDDDDSNDMPF